MKKKLMGLFLTMTLVISLLPVNTVWAETISMGEVAEELATEEKKLPTPILELTKNSRLQLTIPDGEWGELEELSYILTITNKDTKKEFEVSSDGIELPADGTDLIMGWYAEDEMETGNYKAELYLRESGDWAQSDAGSLEFYYKNPGAKYGDITGVVWDKGELSFVLPDNAESNDTVFVQFAKMENGEITAYRYSGESADNLSRAMERFNKLVERNGNGDYYFRMRVISNNLSEKYHGDWSDWSDAYTILNESDETEIPETPVTDIWDGTVATSFAGGKGTKESPYLIENGAQLALVDDYLGKYFRLTEDIYLNDTTDWEDWSETNAPDNEWDPLGDQEEWFSGTFDGDGHTIYGLYMTASENYTAMFARTEYAEIRDLSIEESWLFSAGDMCGLLIGEAMSDTRVINCHNGGNVTTTGGHTAGLIGQAYKCELIADCTNSGNVTNTNNTYTDVNDVIRIAGVVGSPNDTVVENCINTGNISSYGSQLGGVIGHAFGASEITECVNEGAITGYKPENMKSNWPAVGGVLGSIYDSVIVNDCENHGDVVVEWENPSSGGIVGKVNGEDNIVKECLNTADIIGGLSAGGIVGEARVGIVEFCVNEGDITVTDAENSEAGGITGDTRCIVRNSVNKGRVYGAGLCGGITGGTDSYSEDVYNCCNFGSVSAVRYAGGICATIGSNNVVRNCWNRGQVTVGDSIWRKGAVSASAKDGDIFHCYVLTDCCIDAEDIEYVTEITESELKSATFLKTLNDWVEDNQRVDTGYAYWVTDKDGYPVPMGEVPDYTPVTGALTLHQPENGSATISYTSALTEAEITVTVTADTGYIPYQVWFCAAEDPDTLVYAEKTGEDEFTFSMPYGDADVYVSMLVLPENGVWDGTVATSFAGGDGTENNPYLIANASQLAKVESYRNKAEAFRLVADIYLNDTTGWENWTAENKPENIWTPISSLSCIFDGNGHTIYGMYTDAEERYQGLFNQISSNSGCIKNLTIDKSHVMGTDRVGAFAAQNYGEIINCTNKSKVTASEDKAGGIAGYSGDSSLVRNCSNYGMIDAPECFGGIVGEGAAEIVKCVNYADLDGYHCVGGIIGEARSSGRIRNCSNYGDVTVQENEEISHSGEDVGGIAGSVRGEDTIVENCMNYGDITGIKRAGGICGYQRSADVKNCVNEGAITTSLGFAGGITGTVDAYEYDLVIELCVNNGVINGGTSEESYAVGGIAGYMPTSNGFSAVLRNCYNTGSISGYRCVGGIAAELRAGNEGCSVLAENCYSVGTVSGTTTVSGTVALIGTKADSTSVTVQNCYCLNTVSEEVHVYGDANNLEITNVQALSKAEMGKQSSFEGFDFMTVWFIAGDGSYPVFRGAGEEGELGDVLAYNYYENGGIIVTADKSNDGHVYAIAVAYKDGKMVAMDMVELSAGEEDTLILQNWGQDVKLFAVSENQTPLCEAEEL